MRRRRVRMLWRNKKREYIAKRNLFWKVFSRTHFTCSTKLVLKCSFWKMYFIRYYIRSINLVMKYISCISHILFSKLCTINFIWKFWKSHKTCFGNLEKGNTKVILNVSKIFVLKIMGLHTKFVGLQEEKNVY